ncbi:MAG: alanine racemase [Pseudomonadota bacterium]
MSRPLVAEIDGAALAHNYRVAKRAAPGARAFAVIKADAYGHGLARAARTLADEADGFALLEIDRAIELRESGVRQPILLLEGCFSREEQMACGHYRLWPVVHTPAQVAMLEGASGRGALQVFVKINTGMNRLGLAPAAFAEAWRAVTRVRAVAAASVMTHFASADEPDGVGEQLQRFLAVTASVRAPRCLANSAALLRYPETHGDWTRPGIMLYGSSPFADRSAADLGLRPVMTLKSALIAVHELKPGDRVGYGGTFIASDAMRVGTVAGGYADGYPRHAGTGTPVLVGGKRTRTVGRVSMDMLAVDLTPVPEAGIGTPVTLWGEGMPVDEVARAAGTISYELLTRVTARVPRRAV